jgi:hypothetical protein
LQTSDFRLWNRSRATCKISGHNPWVAEEMNSNDGEASNSAREIETRLAPNAAALLYVMVTMPPCLQIRVAPLDQLFSKEEFK